MQLCMELHAEAASTWLRRYQRRHWRRVKAFGGLLVVTQTGLSDALVTQTGLSDALVTQTGLSDASVTQTGLVMH